MKLQDLTPRGDVMGGASTEHHSDKPARDPGCNYVGLRDYFTLWIERLEVFYTRRFEDLDAKTTLALAAADKAVTKAEIATEKRFEGVNEFRATLADQASRLIPREEAISKFDTINRDILTLSKEIQVRRDMEENRRELRSAETRGWLVPMVVLSLISILNLVFNVFLLIKK